MEKVEPKKICSNPDCHLAGIRQPWSNFIAKKKWEDGTMRQPQSRCRVCHAAYMREWQRERAMENPGWRKPQRQRLNARIREDPERLAIKRDMQREWVRHKRNVSPEQYRVKYVPPAQAGGAGLDPTLFVAWLETLGDNAEEIAAVTKVSARHVRDILDGAYKTVAIDVVDRACLEAGITIDDIYPLEVAA